MDETHTHFEAPSPILRGPHWTRGQAAERPAGLAPLRLVLQPSGLVVELNQADMVVGRHTSADVRLPLPDVSRRHCRFVFADGVWQIFDLDSLNGVYVNDEAVEHAALRHNDRLQIGGFLFRVDFQCSAQLQTVTEEEPASDQIVLRSIAEALPRAS